MGPLTASIDGASQTGLHKSALPLHYRSDYKRSGGSMRRSLWVVARVAAVLVVLAASAGRAQAITLTEIMELTRAGLSDEVLLALIEVDQRVFAIDPDTLKTLKDAGVSPSVIVAIVKSGRTPQPRPDPIPYSITDTQPPDPPDPRVDRRRAPGRARGAGRCTCARVRHGRQPVAHASPQSALRCSADAVRAIWKHCRCPRGWSLQSAPNRSTGVGEASSDPTPGSLTRRHTSGSVS